MNRKYLVPILLYTLMIVYASLFPLTGWRLPEDDVLAWLTLSLPRQISKSDLLVNVIAYVPLGFLAVRLFWKRDTPFAAFYLALGFGAGLSFLMELTQTGLPSRTSSVVDLMTNSAGTAIGGGLALLWQRSAAPTGEVARWRERHLVPGPLPAVGIAVVAGWALSQLAPFVPSADLGGIRHALKPLWYTAHDLSLFRMADAATYCFYLGALGVLAENSIRKESRPLPLFLVFGGAVLVAKIFVFGRELSLEACVGLLGGGLLLLLLSGFSRELRLLGGMLLVLAGFAVYELKVPLTLGATRPFNWIPFQGQLAQELTGFGTILEGIWPFAALSCLCLFRFGKRREVALFGPVVVLCLVFLLEWQQRSIPGRMPDVTQVILALAGWLAPRLFLRQAQYGKASPPNCGT